MVLELTDEATERPAEVAVSQLDISGRRIRVGWVDWGGGAELKEFFFLGANKAWVGWAPYFMNFQMNAQNGCFRWVFPASTSVSKGS